MPLTALWSGQIKLASLSRLQKQFQCTYAVNAIVHRNNNPVICVNFKFLGLTFDNSMTWKQHIHKLKIPCNKTLDLFKHLSHKTWGADRVSLLRLYIMLLKPKLDYGAGAYSSASRSLLNSLNPIQNCSIRTTTGAFRSSPVLSLYAESGIKPLQTYRNIKILNYYAHIFVNANHPLHEVILSDMEDPSDDEDNIERGKSSKFFLMRAKRAMKEHNLSFQNILTETPKRYPPLRAPHVPNCKEMYNMRKCDTS